MATSSNLNTVSEPARALGIYGEFDVVVIGGGPTGLAASVSAAKRGARTLLVERYGFLLGFHETRRITGAYALSGEDILSSARFDDVIGINAWPMEMHVDGNISWGFPRDDQRAFNDLPWRMLLPQQVTNLLVAGRCASMTHEGQSAARASGGCFVMGQAAGTAAALLEPGSAFADTDIHRLQQALLLDGVYFDQ